MLLELGILPRKRSKAGHCPDCLDPVTHCTLRWCPPSREWARGGPSAQDRELAQVQVNKQSILGLHFPSSSFRQQFIAMKSARPVSQRRPATAVSTQDEVDWNGVAHHNAFQVCQSASRITRRADSSRIKVDHVLIRPRISCFSPLSLNSILPSPTNFAKPDVASSPWYFTCAVRASASSNLRR